MIRFFKRLSLFLIPVCIYVICIIIIDPFEYFHVVSIVPTRKKIRSFWNSPELSMMGTMIWKLSEYNRSRCDNVILGDSRSDRIQVDSLKQITGQDYYNFGTPGGDYAIYTSLFWRISGRVKLKNVYLGVSFHNYGDTYHRDLYGEAKYTIDHVYPFFTSPFLVNQAFDIAKLGFTRNRIKLCRQYKGQVQIPLDNDPFAARPPSFQKTWDRSVKIQSESYSRYRYPDDYYKRLKEVSEYCKDNNINLVFIIVPNYMECYDLAMQANLGQEMERFKADIRSLGETYDFDYPNELTRNKAYYSDIWHFSSYVYDVIYREVWGKEKGIAIHTYPGQAP
jgi:hypothetical protein